MTLSPPPHRSRRGGLLPLALALCVSLFLLAGPSRAAHPVQPPKSKPNIILILADDLGWSDLQCYGADLHETPHLDRLAKGGVRFTQAYAMPVCSPTRAAILTGSHAARLQMTIWREASLNRESDAARFKRQLIPPVTRHDLPTNAVTLAEALRTAGYKTLHVGKWHLGDAANSPEVHGFDLNIGGTHWGAPPTYFHPFSGPFGQSREFRYVPGLGLGKPGQYLTDRLTDEAIHLIDQADGHPFFLNLCYHNPHTPIEGKPALVRRFADKIKPGMRHKNAAYAAMIATLDENVGRLLRHLDQRRLSRNTVVIFASDNGGYINLFREQQVTDNHPLRSGKGSLYEGGIRVPLIIRAPGITSPGSVCNAPVICMDLFETLRELAGATAPGSKDGRSLVPLLRDPGADLGRDSLPFHYPHYYQTTTPVSALRRGPWKLLHYYEGGTNELYNLERDPAETQNLADLQPGIVTGLLEELRGWLTEVDAGLPGPNPHGAPRQP